MHFAKLFLKSLDLVRSDQNTVVSVKNVIRYLPDPHVGGMLVYGIVSNANRTDVTLFLRRRTLNPEEIIISVVHVRDGLHVPPHIHPFVAKSLRGREQIKQVLSVLEGYCRR